jgi:hypothetical protein
LTSFRACLASSSFPLLFPIDSNFTFQVISSVFGLRAFFLYKHLLVYCPFLARRPYPPSRSSHFDLACRKPINSCAGKMSSTRDIEPREKNAGRQSYEISPTLESASTRPQPCPSPTKKEDTGQKNGNNTLENGNDVSETGSYELQSSCISKWPGWSVWIVNSWIALWQNFAFVT